MANFGTALAIVKLRKEYKLKFCEAFHPCFVADKIGRGTVLQ